MATAKCYSQQVNPKMENDYSALLVSIATGFYSFMWCFSTWIAIAGCYSQSHQVNPEIENDYSSFIVNYVYFSPQSYARGYLPWRSLDNDAIPCQSRVHIAERSGQVDDEVARRRQPCTWEHQKTTCEQRPTEPTVASTGSSVTLIVATFQTTWIPLLFQLHPVAMYTTKWQLQSRYIFEDYRAYPCGDWRSTLRNARFCQLQSHVTQKTRPNITNPARKI